jgi:ABC-type uncharacterized transport system substrate-binding protein
MEIRRAEDIPPAFEALRAHADAQADALYVASDAFISANRTRIITFALSQRLPTIFSYRDYAQAGGLMSYGPNFADLYRRAADIVDKILRGTKPRDIPVEQPTKFEFVINLTTAKALGLTIPASLMSLADELIGMFAAVHNCLLLAQSGLRPAEFRCPLLGVKQTLVRPSEMSAFDPKRTFGPVGCCCAK